MFYYAEINSDYLVINTHSLTEASTNANYIAITEEQYTDGDLIDKYYNSLTGNFEIMADGDATAPSDWITYGGTSMILTTKIDNMQVEINNLASGNSGGVSQDDLQVLEDTIATKADVNHSHTEYALSNHTHDDYATQIALDTLGVEVDGKADASHAHSEYAPLTHSHDDYSPLVHSHTEYATQTSLDGAIETLESEIEGKADVSHTHSEYASSTHLHDEYADANHNHDSNYAPLSHSHDNYVTTTTFDALAVEVDGKAEVGHSHSHYSTITHNHDDVYSLLSHSHTASEIGAATSGHNHNEDYADINHNHNEDYATLDHNHNEAYSPLGHAHSDYATVTALDELSAMVSVKADVSHNHDDRYFTEDELNTKLSGKSDVSHTHTGVYDENGAAASALASANAYTDSKIDALVGEGASTTLDTIGEISSAITDNQDAIDLLNAAIANKANVADLNAHANDTEIHITDAERSIWNAKSNFSGNYNDLTNKPSIPSIVGLASEDYVDEKVGAVTVESIGALPITTVIPTVPTNVSAFTNDAGYLTTHQNLDGLATETYVDTQIDAIDIPNALSDLTADSTHRLVTDTEKATWNAKSNFSGNYNDLTNKPSIPSISGLATETYVDEAVSTKADSGHTHGDIYYTETEIDNLLSGKANSNHNHNSSYDALGTAETKANAVQANLDVVSEDLAEHIDNADVHFTVAERTKLSGIATNANNYTHPNSGVTAGTYKSVTVNAQGHITGGTNPTTLAGYGITDAETKGAANSALNSAKAYADELIADEVANRDSAIATAKSSAISTAASDATTKANNALASAKTYADNAAATVKNDLLNNAGAAYDTLKELGDLIDDNADAIEALEAIASGKANAVHTHAISDIANLQSTLNEKAATNHGTHVSYSTTAPVMDGAASVGTASTVARSDHKHPTDTSRASQTDLDALETVVAGKANSSHTHTIANITDLQSTLDGKAANSHTHSNATTSAAGLMSASDKSKLDGIASGANKYTLPTASSSTLGGVKTTSTVTSNSGYTACPIISGVPYYKDTNTTYNLGSFGITATAAELNALDGITATVTELNYVDGVTSNIQTQLNGKAASSHTHSYAGSSSAGGAATSANKLNTNAGSATQPIYFANGIPVKTIYTLGASVPAGAKFTDTTYSVATTSANGLMSASDKSKLDGMLLATVSEVKTYLAI